MQILRIYSFFVKWCQNYRKIPSNKGDIIFLIAMGYKIKVRKIDLLKKIDSKSANEEVINERNKSCKFFKKCCFTCDL